MSIRLNKAIRELNIGLQTAVEFLKKRSDLGEVRDDLSFKLSDSQYNALVEEFKSDKEVRNQAEKLLQKHPKEKRRHKNARSRRLKTPKGTPNRRNIPCWGKSTSTALTRKRDTPHNPASSKRPARKRLLP